MIATATDTLTHDEAAAYLRTAAKHCAVAGIQEMSAAQRPLRFTARKLGGAQ